MTPAVTLLKKAGIEFDLHEYDHDPGNTDYGFEAAEKLSISFDRIFKTLVVETDPKRFAVGIVPVSGQLDLKLFAKAVKTKKAGMADKNQIQRITGYLPGGVSPLGLKKKLPTIMDISGRNFKTVYVSAGKRGVQFEICPEDLLKMIGGTFKKIKK